MSTTVSITRRFQSTVDDLFNAFTNPELLKQWWGPRHVHTVSVVADVKPGGEYSITLQRPDGSLFYVEGTYLEVERPRRLKFSYAYRGLENNPFPESTITVTFNQVGDQAEVTLWQEFIKMAPGLAGRTGNYEYMFDRLTALLESE